MKSAFAGTLAAVVLFGAAAACWAQARMARNVAEAHRRLATLHYDADDGLDDERSMWDRLPWPSGTSNADIARQRATVNYWRTQYQSLQDLTNASGAQALTDPQMLLVAANASFRSAATGFADRKGSVARLDNVIQSYADVLRRDPDAVDAAYNYEFVSRLRDAMAKAPATRAGRQTVEVAPPARPAPITVDLPAGPTIHGNPGGPPEGTNMSDFKTLSPMRYDEREEQMDPGKGKRIQRKG